MKRDDIASEPALEQVDAALALWAISRDHSAVLPVFKRAYNGARRVQIARALAEMPALDRETLDLMQAAVSADERHTYDVVANVIAEDQAWIAACSAVLQRTAAETNGSKQDAQ